MKEAAKKAIEEQAKATVAAYNGKNEYESWEAAKARLDGMIYMATVTGILTVEEIDEIKKTAKRA